MDARRLIGVGCALAAAVSGCGDSSSGKSPSARASATQAAPASAVLVREDDLAGRVGEHVVVRGSAATAGAGAAVAFEDGTPVYVVGLTEWGAALEGRRVEARGVLRRRAARVSSDEEPRHGLGATYALEDASWAPVGRGG